MSENTYDAMSTDPARADELVLVDGLDRQIGTATKELAHREGLLHRAFSVVLVRDGLNGPELLLAQRAEGKYHSAGLWANSCCSHPRAGEELIDAVERRTREELGCNVDAAREIGSFIYRAQFADGLAEFEYDHVFVGRVVGTPKPDPTEVGAVRWIGVDKLAHELASHPKRFCAWAFTVLGMALTTGELGASL